MMTLNLVLPAVLDIYLVVLALVIDLLLSGLCIGDPSSGDPLPGSYPLPGSDPLPGGHDFGSRNHGPSHPSPNYLLPGGHCCVSSSPIDPLPGGLTASNSRPCLIIDN